MMRTFSSTEKRVFTYYSLEREYYLLCHRVDPHVACGELAGGRPQPGLQPVVCRPAAE